MSSKNKMFEKNYVRKPDSNLLLVDWVEQEIRNQVLELSDVEDAKLPQERELAESFGVSRKTIRAAINRLREQKMIESIRGKGTFVSATPKPYKDVHLIAATPNDSYELMCVGLVSELLGQKGYSANFVISKDPVSDWKRITKTRPSACGAILVGAMYTSDMLKSLVRRSNFPIVCLGDIREVEHGEVVCDSVRPDNKNWAYTATRELILHGHRKIAFLNLSGNIPLVWEKEKLQGYLQALGEYGIEPNKDWIIDLPAEDYLLEAFHRGKSGLCKTVRQQINNWFEKHQLPTALVHQITSEAKFNDLQHYYFRNYFQGDSIIGMLFKESINTEYNGIKNATAACVKFETIVKKALDLLFSKNSDYDVRRCEIVKDISIYERTDGIWQEKYVQNDLRVSKI